MNCSFDYVRKQNISNPYSDIKNSITYNCNKSKQKKSRCNTEYSKSTSKVKYNQNEGLDTTPIGNTEGFRFRNENKDKWISKRGFQVY